MFEENSDFTKWDISNDSTIPIDKFRFDSLGTHDPGTVFPAATVTVTVIRTVKPAAAAAAATVTVAAAAAAAASAGDRHGTTRTRSLTQARRPAGSPTHLVALLHVLS